MSWRDESAPAVQEDLDVLADHALSAAQHLLEKNGEFYPFAVNLTDDGTAQMAAADPAKGERPPSTAVLDLLYDGAAAERDGLRAAAFAAPVETSEGDAVRVEIEHRDGGPALAVLLPYRRGKLRKTFEYGELAAEVGQRHVWDLKQTQFDSPRALARRRPSRSHGGRSLALRRLRDRQRVSSSIAARW